MNLNESSILDSAKTVSLKDLVKSNPKLNFMDINHLQFWKIDGDMAYFLGLSGKSFKGIQKLVELRFKDVGDALRLVDSKEIKDLPLTYFSGLAEIAKRIQ